MAVYTALPLYRSLGDSSPSETVETGAGIAHEKGGRARSLQGEGTTERAELDSLLGRLAALAADRRDGTVDDQEHERLRRPLEIQAADLLRRIERAGPAG